MQPPWDDGVGNDREAPCCAGSDIQVASWLDGGSSSKIAGLALNTAVVGEPLEVLVSVSNPLALELSVSRMRLTFDAEPSSASEPAVSEAAAASGEAAGAGEAEPAEAVPGDFAQVGLLTLVVLQPTLSTDGPRLVQWHIRSHWQSS